MKLETKYGVLEGTVEEFRELLEGEKDLSFFSGKVDRYTEPTYKVVNKDTVDAISGVRVPKGLVLEHASRDWYTTRDAYTDTLGNLYMLSPKDLEDYNMPGIDERFKSLRGETLLIQKEEDKYKVVKEDLYSNLEGLVLLEKGTVLLETEHHLEDSLGNAYSLHPDTIENKLKDFYIVGIRFHFEEHKRNNELYKLTLPNNQF